jgi:hypothetical protein
MIRKTMDHRCRENRYVIDHFLFYMQETPGSGSTAKVIIPIIIGVSGILTMASVAYTLKSDTLPMLEVSGNKEINFTFTFQLIGLAVSFLALSLMYLFNAESFRIFFRI